MVESCFGGKVHQNPDRQTDTTAKSNEIQNMLETMGTFHVGWSGWGWVGQQSKGVSPTHTRTH
eukprot:6470226-Amphidinium_carterae.2